MITSFCLSFPLSSSCLPYESVTHPDSLWLPLTLDASWCPHGRWLPMTPSDSYLMYIYQSALGVDPQVWPLRSIEAFSPQIPLTLLDLYHSSSTAPHWCASPLNHRTHRSPWSLGPLPNHLSLVHLWSHRPGTFDLGETLRRNTYNILCNAKTTKWFGQELVEIWLKHCFTKCYTILRKIHVSATVTVIDMKQSEVGAD